MIVKIGSARVSRSVNRVMYCIVLDYIRSDWMLHVLDMESQFQIRIKSYDRRYGRRYCRTM